MSDFKPFGKAVADQFKKMSKEELFVVDISGDDLYSTYIAAFPEGTNPLFKTKTEHECSCCKNFIRNIGNVVAIEDGNLVSVWDKFLNLPAPYGIVSAVLSNVVRSKKVISLFRSTEKSYGAEQTKQLLPDGTVHHWNHFHGTVSNKHFSKDAATVIGDYNTKVQVFKRGLQELSISALNEVVDLIDSNSIYRGTEFRDLVISFRNAVETYQVFNEQEKHLFVWAYGVGALASFRNTVIGTLVQDLSEGKGVQQAVASFEAKVAPTNYKRPTALITPRMIELAMKTINELGIEDSLTRRYATIEDVSLTNVIWADNSVKKQMKGGVQDLLMQTVKTKPKSVNQKEISIDDFVANVLPKASSLELFVGNNMQSNFMSLTAPVYPDAPGLFKWDNNFAWSYDGNITDSIKEKVKNAGGNVTTAKLRISLAWFNYDDLDIHVCTPNGNVIYFGNKQGVLDVDMNAGGGRTREPVENLSFTSLQNGKYTVMVNQFSQRESTNLGYTLEVENNNKVNQWSFNGRAEGKVKVLEISVLNGVITEINAAKHLVGGGFSAEKWGIATEKFVKVNTLMYSPNYWGDSKVGNKHWFFVLDGCINTEKTRGIYNEFLKPELDVHRKVFEVLGTKTMCESTQNQLSGIGLSSTRNDEIVARVDGKEYKVICF